MGLRGISILLASGDNGVGCSRDCSSFEFDFPSSPYITMVSLLFLNLLFCLFIFNIIYYYYY